MGKSMEGSEEQKQKLAREAKKEGKSASEVGATTGASKQRARRQRRLAPEAPRPEAPGQAGHRHPHAGRGSPPRVQGQ